MSVDEKQVPSLFIFGESKSGKDTLAAGIWHAIPRLLATSTSQLLTSLKQEDDRRAGVESPPESYSRDVLYQYGSDLQKISPEILAVLMMRSHQRLYDAGRIAGFLYVGSRRLAEARYIHDVVRAPLMGVRSSFDVRTAREYQWLLSRGVNVEYDTFREQFYKQDKVEKPELDEMYSLADIIIDGEQPIQNMIDEALGFVYSRRVFE